MSNPFDGTQKRVRGNPFGSLRVDVPPSSSSIHAAAQGRYLYERLGEKGFQQLCGALLAEEFPDVTCMPVGQSDGGRDATRPHPDGGSIVYQVKWSSKPVQSPLAWLKKALDGETENIRRLVKGGATEYFLMTSIAGTSMADRGTMDRVRELLGKRSIELGIAMRCWWRTDIDARLDSAPESLLWSYADMLAGWQLIRYLTAAPRLQEREERLRVVVTKVVATQWHEDSKVKFKQVDLDSYALDDLYVDVEVERVAQPLRVDHTEFYLAKPGELGGVAEYLLNTKLPLTLIRGAPGQGKSTLTQYLCQLHRRVFLDEAANSAVPMRLDSQRKAPRVPLRVDLRDYASWLLGHDPFDVTHLEAKPRRPGKAGRSIESFLARLVEVKSGDMSVRVNDVHELIARFPLLLVLDGLDEVASVEVRRDVVTRIDELTARLGNNDWAPQVVVTTRPNSSGLAEPSPDSFETIVLKPLSVDLRREYLGRWADSRRLPANERATLERIFEVRSAEPHIAQLAENPMQLTILLYLIQKRGDSIPHARTELYRSYMETFLDREAAKSPAVQKHRDDLEEVTAHLGWLFQSLAESAGASGQLPVKKIKQAILSYLYNAAKNTQLIEDLFTAVTDRVWALTSKEQGSFRFDVQPVQEYFAASYLFHVAGAEQPRFDAAEVFRTLVRRPYWFNTCRFYAGFASVNDLVALAEILEEEVNQSSPPFDIASPQVLTSHTRMVIWTLLADGVFAARPKTQRRVARLISDDLGVRLLTRLLNERFDLPALAADRGGAELVAALQETIAADPALPVNRLRADLVARILTASDPADAEPWFAWWLLHLRTAKTAEDQAAWLKIGKPLACGVRVPEGTLNELALEDPDVACAALDAGVIVPDVPEKSRQLLRAVLDGHCSEAVPAERAGEAADLAILLSPYHFRATAGVRSRRRITEDALYNLKSQARRGAAAERLIALDGRYQSVHEATKTQRGQKGTTSVWSNTARALATIHGPSLLAAEITVIGAALPADQVRTGGDFTKDSLPFGEKADYGCLLQDVRFHRKRLTWWRDTFDGFPDNLSRATWTLCLLAVADSAVLTECLDLVDEVTRTLPRDELRALKLASSRTGASELARRLNLDVVERLHQHSVDTGLLVLHHVVLFDEFLRLTSLPEQMLGQMTSPESCSWPAVRALHARMIESPSIACCDLLREAGPDASMPGQLATELSDALLQDILTRPSDVPLFWLATAESQNSKRVRQIDLATHAEGAHWFD